MKVLLGVDLGTSAYKAVAMAPDGEVIAAGHTAVVYRRPAADRVVFSAESQFGRLCRLLRKVVIALPRGAKPAALALSGANGNTLLLDEDYRPVASAISWLDTRAGDSYQTLLPSLLAADVRETVGWPWTRRFPLTQLAWLRAHQPRAWREARHFTLDSGYFHHGLTGRLAVDHSSATTFFLQDQKRLCWHEPYLRALAIDPAALPDLVAPGTPIGHLTAKAARLTGLPAGLPITAGSFDHPSAAIGSGVIEPGDLLLSCGTSWVGFFPAASRSAALTAGMIVDPFRQPNGPWGAMFALTAVGTTIDRYLTSVFPLRKSLSLAQRYARFSAAAANVPGGKEGPPIDPLAPLPATREAKAALVGESSLGQLSRRLMVGTALAMRRRLAVLKAAGFNPRRVILVGGPAKSAVWTQTVADVLDRQLYLAGAAMAGATGAAMLAGVGVGVFRDIPDAVKASARPLTSVSPIPANRAHYASLA